MNRNMDRLESLVQRMTILLAGESSDTQQHGTDDTGLRRDFPNSENSNLHVQRTRPRESEDGTSLQPLRGHSSTVEKRHPAAQEI